MAETLLSPGILTRENDQSFLTQQPPAIGAAIVGPTARGLVNIPTLVTSFSEFESKFGKQALSGSNYYTYFTSITAYNYFQNGGETLLVTRVASGSFTAATSSLIPTGSGGPTTGLSPFELKTPSEGTIMNSTSTEGDGGILPSGSKDNLRWEISGVNRSLGTFTLLIRRGDDNTNNKVVLETWPNLSLDPTQPNYIARAIGDQTQTVVTDGDGTTYIQVSGSYPNKSQFVTVSAVNYTTPNFFDNNGTAKASLTGSIPAASSGSFGGATGTPFNGREAKFYQNISNLDTQGLVADNYTTALALLANKDEYAYNTMVVPGLYNTAYSSTITTLINTATERQDHLLVIDPTAYGATVTSATTEAATRNSSYASMYWPWIQTPDPYSGNNVWVPASTLVPSVFAYNDSTSETWFAPAGFNRGALATAIQAERKLTQGQRDDLYDGKVNPIASFPNTGLVVFGQKTLQTRASALDRVNVRRLLITLKNYISEVSRNLLFEQNTLATRNQFLAQVNPYLISSTKTGTLRFQGSNG